MAWINFLICIIFALRLMQEKDDQQRKGENIVDISSKKKKRGCC
jgi:hypothetical protein